MSDFVYVFHLQEKSFSCFVQRKARTRGVRIQVHQDGKCLVTIGKTADVKEIDRAFHHHRNWIEKQIQRLAKKGLTIHPFDLSTRRQEYALYKERARSLVKRRIDELNQKYDFSFKRIAIKNLRSKWASCSSHGNLNFHYQVILLPDDLLDYLVVHELCHLQEQNHSKKFWELVGKTIPDWKIKRRALKHWHPPSVV